MTTAFPKSAPVDQRTASLLSLIDGDPLHIDDRRRVVEAITATAGSNNGLVEPNRLRQLLTDEHGHSTVYPAVIGSTVCALRHKGVLREAGWVVTTGSRSGNSGKPARSWWLRSVTS